MSVLTASVLLQTVGADTVSIDGLATLGVGAVIALLLIFGLVQAGLAVFQARSLNNQISQGIQAIVGVNNMTELDRVMEDRRDGRGREGERRTEVVNNNGDGGRGDGGGQ